MNTTSEIMEVETTPVQRGLHIGIVSAAILLNATGLLAINLYKKKTNQNIILSLLSTLEILLSMCDIVSLTRLTNHGMFYLINTFVGYQFLICMYILTVDRLVCVIDPFKYRTVITRKKILLAFLVATAVTLTCAFITIFVEYQYFIQFYIVFLCFCYIFVVLAFITYAIIFSRLRNSDNLFRNNDEKKKTIKICLVAGIIILTFIIFYIIPGSLALRYKTLGPTWRLTFAIGFVVDPLTYILGVEHYRESLLNKLKIVCSRTVSNEIQSSTEHRPDYIVESI